MTLARAALTAEFPSEPGLVRTIGRARGASAQVGLADGSKVRVKLLEMEEERDSLRSAVREARVTIEVNGQKTTLDSGNYRLPVKFAGVQIDCPVTQAYYPNHDP